MSETSRELFSCIGIEVEYMIVDRETLDVRPLADRVLRSAQGNVVSELEVGRLSWSNELVAHVVEVKTNGPVESVDASVLTAFEESVRALDDLLGQDGARLLPFAMHPWMDPAAETVLWPHEYNTIYRTYDRIFGCRGHGWSNLQSMHLNLPFAGDGEFARLHQAIRLLLPLLPALAASSPIVDGRLTGLLDNRMHYYRGNSSRIPSVAGDIIPEAVSSRDSYQHSILDRMYTDIAPLDPDGILRHDFLNSRGAIARFERGSIEIRVIDSQECPRADLAIAAGAVGVLQTLVESADALPENAGPELPALVTILQRAVALGGEATVDDPPYLASLGLAPRGPLRALEVWRGLIAEAARRGFIAGAWVETLRGILESGSLADRIRRAVGEDPDCDTIRAVYARIADCLVADRLFEP